MPEITERDKEFITKMYAKGYLPGEIWKEAVETYLSPEYYNAFINVIKEFKKKEKIRLFPVGNWEMYRKTLDDLIKAGLSNRRIGEYFGLSESCIRYKIERLGYKRPRIYNKSRITATNKARKAEMTQYQQQAVKIMEAWMKRHFRYLTISYSHDLKYDCPKILVSRQIFIFSIKFTKKHIAFYNGLINESCIVLYSERRKFESYLSYQLNILNERIEKDEI